MEYLEAIRDSVTHPDSTHDAQVGIEGSGAIASTLMKENFDRKSLLDIVQAGCEYTGYNGYDDYTVGTADIKLEPVGITLTNPLIEIPAEPLEREYEENIDDLYNHILVWSASNPYFPARDSFCEGGVALGIWSGLGNTVVSDDSVVFTVGSKSVKAYNNTDPFSNPAKAKLTLPSSFNFQTYKITDINFMYRWGNSHTSSTYNANPSVTLTDTNGHTVTVTFPKPTKKTQATITLNVGSLNASGTITFNDILTVGSGDYFWVGDISFNWNIVSAQFSGVQLAYTGTWTQINIDGLYFNSALSTDPTLNTALQVQDSASIATYGRRVLNVDAPELMDYAFITTYANSILAVTKNPIIKLKVKHGAKTWARPSQTVHVASMPSYGLTNWYGRIVDLEFDYAASTKMLHSTFTLTPRYQPITSKEWYRGMIAGVINYKQW